MRVVVGAGEVGSAVGAVLSDKYDVEYVDIATTGAGFDAAGGERRVDSLHIAFPWSEHFVREVRGYVATFMPHLVVVHSTVPVGTCDPNGWCHAPIRGRHPRLEQGVRESPMVIGGARSEEASIIFSRCGVRVGFEKRAANTEAAKLWELAQLGIQVRVMKQVREYCERNGLDFDVVYTRFAQDYNEAYGLIDPKFVRPVLDFEPGPLGGHCVAQNAPLLGDSFVDELLGPISPIAGAGK